MVNTGFLKAPWQWNRKLDSDFSVARFVSSNIWKRDKIYSVCLELGPVGARSCAWYGDELSESAVWRWHVRGVRLHRQWEKRGQSLCWGSLEHQAKCMTWATVLNPDHNFRLVGSSGNTWARKDTHTYTHSYTFTCNSIYIPALTYIYMQTHTHVHTHTLSPHSCRHRPGCQPCRFRFNCSRVSSGHWYL